MTFKKILIGAKVNRVSTDLSKSDQSLQPSNLHTIKNKRS